MLIELVPEHTGLAVLTAEKDKSARDLPVETDKIALRDKYPFHSKPLFFL